MNDKLLEKLKNDFFNEHYEEFAIQSQSIGRTLENLIQKEKSEIAVKTIDFVIKYLEGLGALKSD